MRPKRDVSIADGFWTSLVFTGPLLLLGAFPVFPASVHRASLILALVLGLAAMLRPFLHWPAKTETTKTDVASPTPIRPARPLRGEA